MRLCRCKSSAGASINAAHAFNRENSCQERGIKYSSRNKLLEADFNIRLGSHYLRWMLGRYDNNRILASAAYTAGPGNVDKWLDADADLDVWIETILFKETRNYVKNVLAYSAIYNYFWSKNHLYLFGRGRAIW